MRDVEVVPCIPRVPRGRATRPMTSPWFPASVPVGLPRMLHLFTTLLLHLREHGVLFFLDMLRNSIHQRMEVWITRHVFRITGPQCCDQLADALVLLTGFPDEGF